jgi:hypothetical protein
VWDQQACVWCVWTLALGGTGESFLAHVASVRCIVGLRSAPCGRRGSGLRGGGGLLQKSATNRRNMMSWMQLCWNEEEREWGRQGEECW